MSDFVRKLNHEHQPRHPRSQRQIPGIDACRMHRNQDVGREEIDGTGRLMSSNFAGSEYEFIATERMVGGMLVLEAIVPLGKVRSGCRGMTLSIDFLCYTYSSM